MLRVRGGRLISLAVRKQDMTVDMAIECRERWKTPDLCANMF
jgi:hypothetical protein